MLIKYIEKRFSVNSLLLLEQANKIIDEYETAGYKLTLRQLYYQFVARDLIENTKKSYNKIGTVINDGRLAGIISWAVIEDRTRNLKSLSCWESPKSLMEAVCSQYRIDKWDDQPYRPEVWIEKEALVGVISQICNKLEVPYFACKGYTSQSEQWKAAMRFKDCVDNQQKPIVFHLGDHDPSGIDMSRDNTDRLKLLSGKDIRIKRIALNYDQIEEQKPPPNFAKTNDPRFRDYNIKYGNESWELDALEPDFISKLIENEILAIRDEILWNNSLDKETGEKQTLIELMNQLEG